MLDKLLATILVKTRETNAQNLDSSTSPHSMLLKADLYPSMTFFFYDPTLNMGDIGRGRVKNFFRKIIKYRYKFLKDYLNG